MNMSERTQAYWPLAYSLIMRQAGENSGLSTCRLMTSATAAVLSFVTSAQTRFFGHPRAASRRRLAIQSCGLRAGGFNSSGSGMLYGIRASTLCAWRE
jgi:hypothetical protein